MTQKVIRTGNSMAVTIPAKFTKDLGIRVGDVVKVDLEEDKGEITYIFSGVKQLPLAENFLSRPKK
ncbi:MAG: AbrB/MazE/SpoVT family DNA-binding domain-containing protein [bacterium]|nr:AbrB/MazE/SpoVT family DNA-binding domain-containing protein [bacterium]